MKEKAPINNNTIYFARTMLEYISSTGAKNLNEYYEKRKNFDDMPTLSTLRRWTSLKKPKVPDVRREGWADILSFLPDEYLTDMIRAAKISAKELHGLSPSFPDLKQEIAKMKTLNTILDEYLNKLPSGKKNGLDFIDQVSVEWGISTTSLGFMLGKEYTFFTSYKYNVSLHGDKAGLGMKGIDLFSKEMPNEYIPESHLMDRTHLLKLHSLFNGQLKKIPAEEIPEKTLENMRDNYIKRIKEAKTRDEKEILGMQAFREVVGHLGYYAKYISVLVTGKDNSMFEKYLMPGGNQFNNTGGINDITRPKKIADAIFYGTDTLIQNKPSAELTPDEISFRKLAKDFANIFMGLPGHYARVDIFKDLMNRDLSFEDAFLISRYQQGKDKEPFSKELRITHDRYIDIEHGRHSPSLRTLLVFVRKQLGINDRERGQLVEDSYLGLTHKYEPSILEGMKVANKNLKSNTPSENDITVKDAVNLLMQNRGISNAEETGARIGLPNAHPMVRSLMEKGTLPTFITNKNKNEYLEKFATILGVPLKDRTSFADTLFELDRTSKTRSETPSSNLGGQATVFNSRKPRAVLAPSRTNN